MIVVDVETSGLEPDKHSLLSIGAVNFSDPSDIFYEECRIWDGAHVDPEALKINGFTEEQIRDPQRQSEGELVTKFLAWIQTKEDYTVGGQNPHVDIGFIKHAAFRAHANFFLAYRVIDLHSIVYFDMTIKKKEIPTKNHHSDINSDSIMKYVGIPSEPKPHIGINGAKWEAEAFSRLMYKKSLFAEFKDYPVL